MTKLCPEIRNVTNGHISDENLKKLLHKVRSEMSLEIIEDAVFDNIDNTNLFLLSGGITNWYVKPAQEENSQKFRDIIKELSFLRRYSYTLGNLPVENFLNSYEGYQVEENSDIIDASQRFLKSDKNPRLLWVHGEPGVGKSHLLSAMLERVIRQQVEWEFDKLDDDSLLLCPPYIDRFDKEMKCPNFTIKGFGGKLYSQRGKIISHARDKRLSEREIFNLANDYTLFLDDVPIEETTNSNIISYLQKIHNENIGSIVITSNYSMSNWIEQNAHLMRVSSPQGLEDRVREFGREFEIKSDSKRRGVDW
ncbi:MAG: hypothetical protein LAT82_02170 [Nanoarchaeota archaeon]|nr:hypothetical protein [Nanoarchaeota archaeon]